MEVNRRSAWQEVVRASRGLVLIAFLSILGPASQTVWAGINEWTSLGPDGGGVRALAIDPQNPSTVYAVTFAGVFKSTNGGASWRAANRIR